MPITVNEGGILYQLDTVTANEGGILQALDTVHANEGGTLQEIFSAWIAPSDISGSYSVAAASGVNEQQGSFTLTDDAVVTVTLSNIVCTGGDTTRFVCLYIADGDSTRVIGCGEVFVGVGTNLPATNPASATLSAGTYSYYGQCVNVSARSSGPTWYKASYDYTIEFSKP